MCSLVGASQKCLVGNIQWARTQSIIPFVRVQVPL